MRESEDSSATSSGTSCEDRDKLDNCRISSSPPGSSRGSRFHNPTLTPFKLQWSYGVNPCVPVINLTSCERTLITYACAHVAAMYDYTSRDMYLLQGHQNYVSAISTDSNGKWLLTADAGKDGVVIVWDTETRVAIRTLFNAHGMEELLTAKLSPNAKYIVTVSNESEMVLSFWLWSFGHEAPDATTVLTGLGNDRVKEIVFRPDFPDHFLIGMESNVVFVTWENGTLIWKHAQLNGEIDRFGVFNASAYIVGGREALTGTSNGHVLVWGNNISVECLGFKRRVSNSKKHMKSLHLQSCGITVITNHENLVVIGNVLGHIKFYDSQLKLMFCCQKFGLDAITSISFHLKSRRRAPAQTYSESFVPSTTSTLEYVEVVVVEVDSEDEDVCSNNSKDKILSATSKELLSQRRSKYGMEKREKYSNLASNITVSMDVAPNIEPIKAPAASCNGKFGESHDGIPADYTCQRTPFIIDDFIVSTTTSRVARIDMSSLKCHYILHRSAAAVTAVDAHPDRDLLATGNIKGCINLFEYNDHHLLISKQTPVLPPFEQLIARDVTGKIINYVTCPQSHESLSGVTSLKFSPDGRELACGTQSGAIWMLDPVTLVSEEEIPFKHSATAILDIVFSEKSDYMAYRDDSMAAGAYRHTEPNETDRASGTWCFLGKYHSHSLSIREVLFGPPSSGGSVPRLFTLAEDRNFVEYDLENSGPYPEPGLKILKIIRIEHSALPLCMAWYPKFEVERLFVFSNTEYKFKLLNDCTKLIQGTYLGPSFGTPVTKMAFLPMRNMHNQAYMVFSTDTQIGLQLLPFDGNPFKIVGMIGHPLMIIRMCVSYCGEFLFTIGIHDPCVLMWRIIPRAVDVMAELGGHSLLPFYCLLDGGQHGWLSNEMQDMFYYAQILQQGENTTATRTVSDKLSITQLPNLMRAVGYYPDAYEMEELMTEVVSKNYAKTGQSVEEITFEEFVKLYVNHRRPFGVPLAHVKKAFAAFSKPELANNPAITADEFLKILIEHGDRMSIEDAHDALTLLVPTENKTDGTAADINFSFLPKDISYKDFITGILGVESTKDKCTTPTDKIVSW